jgi:hypothetical protein
MTSFEPTFEMALHSLDGTLQAILNRTLAELQGLGYLHRIQSAEEAQQEHLGMLRALMLQGLECFVEFRPVQGLWTLEQIQGDIALGLYPYEALPPTAKSCVVD